MTDWNQVEATVSIGGSECKFTTIYLKQVFNGHHVFDIGVLCPPLPGENVWYNERESMIAMQGQSVVIRMKHVISGDESIFKGIITEIGMDGERGVSGTIHYRGCSPTVLLESGKTMDSFMDYTLSAIVGEVVKNYGNGVEIVNKPLFNEQIPYVQMHEETGYEFLRRIAYQYGEWFYYDGQKLHFGNPQKDKNETVTYDVELETVSFGSRIAPFHYSRHDYMAEDDRPLYADDSARVNGINTYLANAIRTSESIYQSPTTLYNKAIVGHPVHMNRLLEFEKGRDTASLVWLRGKSKTCRVRIGEPIAVKIPASMCNRRDLGQYRVMSVIHEVDKNGVYSNTFEGIPASMERIPVNNVVIPEAHPMLAKVISNADPESQGRVKVQFVWQEEQNKTTNWMRVRSLDAGKSEIVLKNRGFVFVPEENDQVIVCFEPANPSRPYVSGSMFNEKNGYGGGRNNSIKSIITRSGHTLIFDDTEGGENIILKDKSGNELMFKTSEESIEITAQESLFLNAKKYFKVPEISIQHKILVGHLILFAIIACIFGILQHERMRISDIEKEARHIQQVQRKVNTVHRHITLLAMLGETAISWERKDFADYRSLRQYVDSTLLDIRKENEIHVARSQVDSLRSLLKIKEEHLAQIMYLIQSRDGHGVLQFSKIPYNVFPQTITRKKKGLAGFFGGKETVEVTPSTSAALHALNKELLSMQNELNDNIDVCTDSLRRHNKVINGKLRSLMTTMNDQAEQILEEKEKQLNASYDRSKSIITWLVISAVILLIVSYLIIQKDLREKQKTSKMLEETIEQNAALLQMRNKIILTISHDIRSPLNVISATVELARREVDNQRRDTYLSNIESVCLHVVHLLNNLLDVYRLNQSKEECNYVPFSLHEMLDRIASRFSGLVNDKGLLFNTSFDNTDVRLRGDVDRIEQIVGNLLSNAIKFTECGEISFHAGYSQGKLYLEVTDSGIGMTEETLARIFRPFERQMTANNTDGFGLGLSIIQGLVHLFNGEIDVKSKIHQGSTFKVTLPLEETDEPLECEKPVLTHTGHLPHNILVIDDDSMLRAVIKDLLERNGINCTTCASAKELVKEMREKDYDLLLTDIQMPGTNGFNLLTLLRHSNIGNSRTIPVIAMTARGEQTKESLQEAGFTDCIYKPFSYNELLNLLSSINQCHVAASPPSDLDALLSEVLDKEKLLFTLIEQSRKDRDELLAALSASNRRQMREIVHRMQPVWELLHMEDILFEYRDILKDDQVSDVVLKNHTRQILSHVSTLMTKAEKELTRLKNEKESIDC